jgi:hypothetical protein
LNFAENIIKRIIEMPIIFGLTPEDICRVGIEAKRKGPIKWRKLDSDIGNAAFIFFSHKTLKFKGGLDPVGLEIGGVGKVEAIKRKNIWYDGNNWI